MLMTNNLKEVTINEHTLFENLLRDEIIIIDLGAHRGGFSDNMSNLYNVKKAILVEASPVNFSHIENKSNYVLYNNVIANTDDNEIDFYEYDNPLMNSHIFKYDNGSSVKVKTKSLKSIIIENNIDYVDVLKVDIEGGEYDILLSLDEELCKKINQITVEFHDFIDISLKKRNLDVIDHLTKLGFKHKSKPITFMNNSDHFDVIFYKEEPSIPKILHMVWVGKQEPPQYFINNLNKWKSLMPHWTYMIWTNDKMTEEYFDKDYLDLMSKVINPSQVSDFIRFYVMNKWGGYYLDADVTPLRNLEELPVQHPIVLCNDLPETGPNYMMCAFMAGVPNHPLWKTCVEECWKVDLSVKYGEGITPTGPAVLGYVSQQRIPWDLVGGYTQLPYWYFYRNRVGDPGPYMPDRIMRDHPDAFGNHFYAESWR